MNRIFPVTFNGTDEHIVFVAFDRKTADDFAKNENNEAECEILTVDEVALIDNYGFHCNRSDIKIIAPWIGHITPNQMRHYAPEYQARRDREYIREMSMGG